MQVGISVAYNLGEVKLAKINHWICVQREDFQLRWDIKIQVKSRVSYRVCKTTVAWSSVFAQPITNPTFSLYFDIPSQLKILSLHTYPMVYFIKLYFTYTVSNWDPNLHFMS